MGSVRHVLIVEDLPDVADWLYSQVSNFLRPEKIDCAFSVAEASGKIGAQKYDLALMDLGQADSSFQGDESFFPLHRHNYF